MRELRKATNLANLAKLRELLGPPPVLSTENAKAYDEIMARFIQCHEPRDFMEQMFIKQLTDFTWEIIRYTRHKPLAIERKFQDVQKFQAKRAKAAAQNRARQVGPNGPARTDVERMLQLEDVVDSAVEDVDEILMRPPIELDHARAFEGAIAYYQRLDQLLNTAVARRNDVLDQLERYRCGLGRRLRKISDEIIDTEFHQTGTVSPQAAISPAPLASETNDIREEDSSQPDQCQEELRTTDQIWQSSRKPQRIATWARLKGVARSAASSKYRANGKGRLRRRH